MCVRIAGPVSYMYLDPAKQPGSGGRRGNSRRQPWNAAHQHWNRPQSTPLAGTEDPLSPLKPRKSKGPMTEPTMPVSRDAFGDLTARWQLYCGQERLGREANTLSSNIN